MPRRRTPHPFAASVGRRIKQLRQEAGLTQEQLAYESELGSKGHLSNLERGLAVPTVQTLKVLADHLGVLPLDLLTFPEDDPRQALIDASRNFQAGTIRRLLREADKG